MPGLRRSCEGAWRVLWTSWDTWGVIFALLGRLLASFWFSWGTFWRHFGSLEARWDAISAQVGPSWPKIMKKVDFSNSIPRFGTQVETQNGEKSMSETIFFLDAFLTSNFIDFSTILDLNFGRVLDRFLDSKRKCRFFKIELSPRREHNF